ncbi:hypothetical protein LTR66_016728 [Elasticomyces elasticus]|nr:hypothetical protein LTR66_016728 [Elasticomyces elasticus]
MSNLLMLTLSPRAVIKKVSNYEHAARDLQREVKTYGLPGVASAECFRKMYEKIDDSTIALEWLDTTLAEVEYRPEMRIYSVITAVLKAAFTSYIILEDQQHVNTVGDLGLVVPIGKLFDAQPFAMHAPEVFLGKPCTEPSQV